MPKVKIERREFDGHVEVSISPGEVRLWVCNDQGMNIFRLKALGKVHVGIQDVIILNFPKTKTNSEEGEHEE